MNQTTQQSENWGEKMGHAGSGSQISETSKSGDGKSGNMWSNGESKAEQHSEGVVAKTIEQQTAKLPSDLFLWGAIGAMGASAIMEFTGNKDKSRFFGQWVAPLLLFGVYNKLVKIHGSDRTESE